MLEKYRAPGSSFGGCLKFAFLRRGSVFLSVRLKENMVHSIEVIDNVSEK